MNKTLSHVSFIVHENQKFQVSDRLLCTISGGQDSILNVILLYHLEVFYFFRLNLGYCNHFWQPTNFYTLFELLKFSYLVNKPMSNFVPKQKIISEEEAHFWRQKNFYQIGTYLNLTNIILGHSLSDQIETSFWHFVRGSGPAGLTSLKQNSIITNKDFKKVLAKVYSTPKSYENKSQIKFLKKNIEQKKYFLKITAQTRFFPRLLHSDLREQQRYLQNKEISLSSEATSAQPLGIVDASPKDLGCKEISLKGLDGKTASTRCLGKYRTISNLKLNTEAHQYIYLFYIAKKSRIKVRRPLLCFSRTTISKLINQNQLPRIIDTTNNSKKLIRNKLRLVILPLLNSSLQIKFQGNIKKCLNIVEEEQAYFSILEKSLIKIYLNNPFKITYLLRVPLAIKRALVKSVLEHYITTQVIMNYIMQIINFIL